MKNSPKLLKPRIVKIVCINVDDHSRIDLTLLDIVYKMVKSGKYPVTDKDIEQLEEMLNNEIVQFRAFPLNHETLSNVEFVVAGVLGEWSLQNNVFASFIDTAVQEWDREKLVYILSPITTTSIPDTELLVLVAGVSGILKPKENLTESGDIQVGDVTWNPLRNNKDAFTLIVQHGMKVSYDPSTRCAVAELEGQEYKRCADHYDSDPVKAMRYVIACATARVHIID